jgi:hypothetical protein
MTSFKESGMIEFTSDCLLALQHKTVRENRQTFADDKGKSRASQKDLLEEAEKRERREMIITVLKNRWGSCYHKEGSEILNYFEFIFEPAKDLYSER